jgi:hypothetical protein
VEMFVLHCYSEVPADYCVTVNSQQVALGCLHWFEIIVNFFMWVVVEFCLELLLVFIVCLCGICTGLYSGTLVIGYDDTVTVCDVLGLVSLTVGLMW